MHLGIIGYGNITETLLGLLEAEPVEALTVLVRPGREARARSALAASAAAPFVTVVDTPDALADARPDIVAECAGQGAVADLVPPLLDAGLPVIVASVGALADDALAARLNAAAHAGGTRIILPAGAVGGVDLLAALAPAGGLSVSYRGTKPPAAWKGTAAEAFLDLSALTEPAVFFRGNAREAAQTYRKNANVAATLALAGPGFAATSVELVADPAARANIHHYVVTSALGRFAVEIENAPSPGNAKTSVATVYSILREINRMRRAVVI
ncbi:aspartate dehydrogenase [Rhodophyticola sp. MJ-SS7]|nr:aspartate dehydrogenase [Rhodophyticola sp. MJ-SS7]